MSHHCPNCQRLVYNRRLKNCGYCAAPIPIEIQFTEREKDALDQKMAELQEQRKEREREAERKAAEKRHPQPYHHHLAPYANGLRWFS